MSAASGTRIAAGWRPSQRGGPPTRRFAGRGVSVEEEVSARGARKPESQAPSGAPVQAGGRATPRVGAFAAARPSRPRLSDRLVDVEADRRSDRDTVRRPLRPFRSLARAPEPRLELSETRRAGTRTRRRSHRPVASTGLAAYKKTLAEAVELLFFSMKQASCSNRWSAGPGAPKGIRPCSTGGNVTIASPGFRRSLPRPGTGTWTCILPSRSIISVSPMSRPSWQNSSNTFPVGSSWSGIAGPFIDPRPSVCRSDSPGESELNGCPRMPRNSIPMNRSGPRRSTGTWPISARTIFLSLRKRCDTRWSTRKVICLSCVRSSSMRDSSCDIVSLLLYPFKDNKNKGGTPSPRRGQSLP